MAIYFAFHRLKKPGDQISDALNRILPDMIRTMKAGETSCMCLKSWNPLAYEREDYFFSLWEAIAMEDIKATIESFGLLEYFTLDCMQVDEIDWTILTR